MASPSSGGKNLFSENGKEKADLVALRDLAFWLPHTKGLLRDGIPYVRSFDALVKMPIAQIGYILAIVITIIRKNRVVEANVWRTLHSRPK